MYTAALAYVIWAESSNNAPFPPAAAKVLRLGDHPGQLDNFVREASLLRQLRHREPPPLLFLSRRSQPGQAPLWMVPAPALLLSRSGRLHAVGRAAPAFC